MRAVSRDRSVDGLLDSIEQAVQTGNLREAQPLLEKVAKKHPPRDAMARLAQLCRRAGMPDRAIALLHPYVFPPPRAPQEANDAEKLEYAASLSRVGLPSEAIELIESVRADAPEKLLYRAYAEIRRWDYAASLPWLKRFLAHDEALPYQRIAARVNLAAGLVVEREHEKAAHLLRELLRDTSLRGNQLLCGNVLEIATENLILQGRYAEARRTLEKAAKMLSLAPGIHAFAVRKWEAVLDLAQSKRKLEGLRTVRREARRIRHWEAIRDCDRFRAMFLKEEALVQRLLAGTREPAFRRRLAQDLGLSSTEARFAWRGESETPPAWPAALVLDVKTGETNAPEKLKVGSMLHRFVAAVSSDLYRPLEVALLFRDVYRDERYHPESSPQRIYQLVRSLRAWLEKNEFPVELKEYAGAYALRCRNASACLWLGEASTGPEAKQTQYLVVLRERFGSDLFSAEQVAKQLGISARSALRVITEGRDANAIERVRVGKSTRYRMP